MRISWFHRLLDMVSPRTCMVCGRRLGVTEEGLCTVCNLRLPRTGYCHSPYDNAMARLFWGKIPIERCAALFYYQSHSEASVTVYGMKYGKRRDVAMTMGKVAAADFMREGFFDGIDALIPVPLEKRRERERGYNQSECIAEGISEVTGITVEKRAVARTSFKGSQTHKSSLDRLENVKDAFVLTDSESIRGRHILLVDDIVTTGATICACAGELMKAEGVRLSVMSLGYACNQFRMVNNDIESQNMFGATIDDFYLNELIGDF